MRGFFFSHIGWLLVRKHPDVIEKGQKLDLSDIKADKVVMFQRRWVVESALVGSHGERSRDKWAGNSSGFDGMREDWGHHVRNVILQHAQGFAVRWAVRNELFLSYEKCLESSATSSPPTSFSCLPTLQHLASSRLRFPPQSHSTPAHPTAQLLLWLAQSPHTGASETSLEIVHLPGHVCAPLPSVFWKQYGERRVENGDVRGAVTGKNSLHSLVPLG